MVTYALPELGAAERATVFDELLRSRPELRAEAGRIARAKLVDADVESVAEAVAWELRHRESDELFELAGEHRWGCVDPTDAAWELLEEAVAGFDREIERLLKLEMLGPAVETAVGMIAGLYQCRECDDNDLVLAWALDLPL